jgi:hypothetical protein
MGSESDRLHPAVGKPQLDLFEVRGANGLHEESAGDRPQSIVLLLSQVFPAREWR